MAMFLHLADSRDREAIGRSGLRAGVYHLHPRTRDMQGGPALPSRAVFCVPVVPNIQVTLQWLRVLKHDGHRTSCAVQFRLGDEEQVFAAHFRDWPLPMTAAEAVRLFLAHADPRGLQVLVPHRIAARDIHRIRAVPQIMGWRHYPDAHGQEPPWYAKGEIGARRLRERVNTRWYIR